MIDKLLKKIEKHEQKIAKLNDKIDGIRGCWTISCSTDANGDGCGDFFQIKSAIYLRTFWYEEPYGCTGGDNWIEGDGECICPSCGHRIRLYKRPDIMEQRRLFKYIEKCYER